MNYFLLKMCTCAILVQSGYSYTHGDQNVNQIDNLQDRVKMFVPDVKLPNGRTEKHFENILHGMQPINDNSKIFEKSLKHTTQKSEQALESLKNCIFKQTSAKLEKTLNELIEKSNEEIFNFVNANSRPKDLGENSRRATLAENQMKFDDTNRDLLENPFLAKLPRAQSNQNRRSAQHLNRKTRQDLSRQEAEDNWAKCALKSELQKHALLEDVHIASIKQEVEKLQQLVRLLQDQQYVLNILNDFDSKSKAQDIEEQKQLMKLFYLLKNSIPSEKTLDTRVQPESKSVSSNSIEVERPKTSNKQNIPDLRTHGEKAVQNRENITSLAQEIKQLKHLIVDKTLQEVRNKKEEEKLERELKNQKKALQDLQKRIENLKNPQTGPTNNGEKDAQENPKLRQSENGNQVELLQHELHDLENKLSEFMSKSRENPTFTNEENPPELLGATLPKQFFQPHNSTLLEKLKPNAQQWNPELLSRKAISEDEDGGLENLLTLLNKDKTKPRAARPHNSELEIEELQKELDNLAKTSTKKSHILIPSPNTRANEDDELIENLQKLLDESDANAEANENAFSLNENTTPDLENRLANLQKRMEILKKIQKLEKKVKQLHESDDLEFKTSDDDDDDSVKIQLKKLLREVKKLNKNQADGKSLDDVDDLQREFKSLQAEINSLKPNSDDAGFGKIQGNKEAEFQVLLNKLLQVEGTTQAKPAVTSGHNLHLSPAQIQLLKKKIIEMRHRNPNSINYNLPGLFGQSGAQYGYTNIGGGGEGLLFGNSGYGNAGGTKLYGTGSEQYDPGTALYGAGAGQYGYGGGGDISQGQYGIKAGQFGNSGTYGSKGFAAFAGSGASYESAGGLYGPASGLYGPAGGGLYGAGDAYGGGSTLYGAVPYRPVNAPYGPGSGPHGSEGALYGSQNALLEPGSALYNPRGLPLESGVPYGSAGNLYGPESALYGPASASFRPGGALYKPGSALYKPESALYRPGGALYRPGGALYRPGGALYRPAGAFYGPGKGLHGPGSPLNEAGSGSFGSAGASYKPGVKPLQPGGILYGPEGGAYGSEGGPYGFGGGQDKFVNHQYATNKKYGPGIKPYGFSGGPFELGGGPFQLGGGPYGAATGLTKVNNQKYGLGGLKYGTLHGDEAGQYANTGGKYENSISNQHGSDPAQYGGGIGSLQHSSGPGHYDVSPEPYREEEGSNQYGNNGQYGSNQKSGNQYAVSNANNAPIFAPASHFLSPYSEPKNFASQPNLPYPAKSQNSYNQVNQPTNYLPSNVYVNENIDAKVYKPPYSNPDVNVHSIFEHLAQNYPSEPSAKLFRGQQQQAYETADGGNYSPAANIDAPHPMQSYANPPQNPSPDDSYTQQKVSELKTQIYGLENVINNLNRPEYIQKPEDHEMKKELDQKINYLKNMVNYLSQDAPYSNSGAVASDSANFAPNTDYQQPAANSGGDQMYNPGDMYQAGDIPNQVPSDHHYPPRPRRRRQATPQKEKLEPESKDAMNNFFRQLKDVMDVIKYYSQALSGANNTEESAKSTNASSTNKRDSNMNQQNFAFGYKVDPYHSKESNQQQTLATQRQSRQATKDENPDQEETHDALLGLYNQLNNVVDIVNHLAQGISKNICNCSSCKNCLNSTSDDLNSINQKMENQILLPATRRKRQVDEEDDDTEEVWNKMSSFLKHLIDSSGSQETDGEEEVEETKARNNQNVNPSHFLPKQDLENTPEKLQQKLQNLRKQLELKMRSNFNRQLPLHNQRSALYNQNSVIRPSYSTPNLRSSYYGQPGYFQQQSYYPQPTYYHQPNYYQKPSYQDEDKFHITKLKSNKKFKKSDILDKIFSKILDKIFDKLVALIPKITKKLLSFGFGKLFYDDDYGGGGYSYGQNGYGQNGYEQNDYGVQTNFKNLGLFGYIPMIILKLLTSLSSFVRQLQKNKFIKTFLVPALVTGGTAGLVVFLVWWLTGDDLSSYGYYGQNGYDSGSYGYSDGYGGGYRNSDDYVDGYRSNMNSGNDNGNSNRNFDDLFYNRRNFQRNSYLANSIRGENYNNRRQSDFTRNPNIDSSFWGSRFKSIDANSNYRNDFNNYYRRYHNNDNNNKHYHY